jgi:hypothetical protein
MPVAPKVCCERLCVRDYERDEMGLSFPKENRPLITSRPAIVNVFAPFQPTSYSHSRQ